MVTILHMSDSHGQREVMACLHNLATRSLDSDVVAHTGDLVSESMQVLLLHGHEHPRGFVGAEWDDSGVLGGVRIFRSHVCSSASGLRGMAHQIVWDGVRFSCRAVFGIAD